MKNVTITLPDPVYRAARIAAATEGKSLSRYVADRLGDPAMSGFGETAQARFTPPEPGAASGPDEREARIERLRAFLHGPGIPGVAEGLAALRADKDDRGGA